MGQPDHCGVRVGVGVGGNRGGPHCADETFLIIRDLGVLDGFGCGDGCGTWYWNDFVSPSAGRPEQHVVWTAAPTVDTNGAGVGGVVTIRD